MRNKITIEDVKGFIEDLEVEKFREKTTIVKAVLKNGFILVEHSSCVDVAYGDVIETGLPDELKTTNPPEITFDGATYVLKEQSND